MSLAVLWIRDHLPTLGDQVRGLIDLALKEVSELDV